MTLFAVLTLLISSSANAENVNVYTKNASFATDVELTVPLHEFGVIGRFSGKNNYYSILPDGNASTMIHADYRSPMKTVIYGYKFSDEVKKIHKVKWEWRVVTAPKGARENIKEKNDSGASVYLLFKKNMTTYTIKYVFSNSLPVDTTFEKKDLNPLNQMQMVVASNLIESQSGSWVPVEVMVESEFRRLFNIDCYVPLRGVGILTDGDQTGSNVIADYRNFTYSQTE